MAVYDKLLGRLVIGPLSVNPVDGRVTLGERSFWSKDALWTYIGECLEQHTKAEQAKDLTKLQRWAQSPDPSPLIPVRRLAVGQSSMASPTAPAASRKARKARAAKYDLTLDLTPDFIPED